jgi:hypothetical protein
MGKVDTGLQSTLLSSPVREIHKLLAFKITLETEPYGLVSF